MDLRRSKGSGAIEASSSAIPKLATSLPQLPIGNTLPTPGRPFPFTLIDTPQDITHTTHTTSYTPKPKPTTPRIKVPATLQSITAPSPPTTPPSARRPQTRRRLVASDDRGTQSTRDNGGEETGIQLTKTTSANPKLATSSYLQHSKNFDITLSPSPVPPTSEISGNYENSSKVKFNLEDFDDLTFELLSPQEWIELGPRTTGSATKAKSRFRNISTNHISWEQCEVLDFDSSRNSYRIKWLLTGKQKFVKRHNLLFDDEDRVMFERRVQVARASLARAETEANYSLFTQEYVDDAAVVPISESNVQSILHKARAKSGRRLESSWPLLDEVFRWYRIAIKRSIADIWSNNDEKRAKIEEQGISIPKNKLLLAPERGQVITGRTEIVSRDHVGFIGELPVLRVLQAVWNLWQIMQSNSSCLDFKIEYPIAFEHFLELQGQALLHFKGDLHQWSMSIINSIHEHLSGAYSLAKIMTREMYLGTDLMRLLRLINFKLEYQLQSYIANVLDSYAEFVERYNIPAGYCLSYSDLHEGVPRSLQPLLNVSLAIFNGEITFVPSCYDIKAQMLELIEGILQSTKDAIQIEGAVLPSLALEARYISTLSPNHPTVLSAHQRIKLVLESNFTILYELQQDLATRFEEVLQMDNASFIPEQYIKNFTLGECRRTIGKLQLAAEQAGSYVTNSLPLFMICVNCTDLKSQLANSATRLANKLLEAYALEIRELNQAMSSKFHAMLGNIAHKPQNPEQWEAACDYLLECEQDVSRMVTQFEKIKKTWEIFEEFSFAISPQDFRLYITTYMYPKQVLDAISERKFQLEQEKQILASDLRETTSVIETDLEAILKAAEKFEDYVMFDNYEEYYAAAKKIEKQLFDIEELPKLVNSQRVIFSMPTADLAAQIEIIRNQFTSYLQLWTTVNAFQTASSQWLHGAFDAIDAEAVERNVGQWFAVTKRLINALNGKPSLPVAEKLYNSIEAMHEYVPLIVHLRNPGLRVRHWNKLSSMLNTSLGPGVENTLSGFIQLGFMNKLTVISEISAQAAKEHHLEKMLDGMVSEWDKLELNLVPYRQSGVHVLRSSEELSQLLEEHIVKASAMKGAAFIKPFEDRIRIWEDKLYAMEHFLDEWLQCQGMWLYLEPIFASSDITRQMPVDSRRFMAVDGLWRTTMEQAVRQPNLKVLGSKVHLMQNLIEANKRFEVILKGLNGYMETKRLSFPRFFFLSNEGLLAILSQTREPKAVVPHLTKCFENIKDLEFEHTNEEFPRITAILSAEGERVPLLESVRTSENVDNWLEDLETAMRSTIQAHIGMALERYPIDPCFEPGDNWDEWSHKWEAQVVLASCHIMWTAAVSKALSVTAGGKGLLAHLGNLNSHLSALLAQIRGSISQLRRATLEVLIISLVHARDVASTLIRQNVGDDMDYEWTSHLRYYWEDGTLRIKMATSSLAYGYEYLGNTTRLVPTTLTDRCYLTLMGAVFMHLGGMAEGPAGTGKTETVKDLAKHLATQCIIFNCSEGLNITSMGKFFKGIASSGAWCCFDEFNRIEVEVLSVVAQQMLALQKAIASAKSRLMFEGQDIRLDPKAAVFITLNPGYAGRAILPDNLKALFRPIAMTAADSAMIAEITLFSYGFTEARTLARKLIATYKMSAEQLSAQSHYDFGLRAIKTTLLTAGATKQLDININDIGAGDEEDALERVKNHEAALLVQALHACNIPKLVVDDIALFEGIVKDIFLSIQPNAAQNSALVTALHEAAKSSGLIPIPEFLHKCVQVFDTLQVRHGIMLVGETMSGKTACMETLAKALVKLAADIPAQFMPVKLHVINPKALSIDQLYGSFDSASHEWADGVLPKIVRNCLADIYVQHWIIFDGPVDSMWIENMNSVLDDNMKLCLTSGEVITLTKNIKMMFELSGLENASPATVSRCGMVYMTPEMLGWYPQTRSWASEDSIRSLALPYFDWFVPPTLIFIRTYCHTLVALPQSAIVESATNILTGQIAKWSGATIDIYIIGCAFVFSLAWAAAGVLRPDHRECFNTFLKSTVSTIAHKEVPTPSVPFGSIYEYFYSADSKDWVSWHTLIPPLAILPNEHDITNIWVDTVESVRISYLVDLLASSGKRVLLVGPAASGKTSILKSQLRNRNKYLHLHMAHYMTPDTVQGQLERILVKRGRDTLNSGTSGEKVLVVVDDLHAASKDATGVSATIEMLRLWMGNYGWYNTKCLEWKKVHDVILLASLRIDYNNNRQVATDIDSRMLRHFTVITVANHDSATLQNIFEKIIDAYSSPLFIPMKELKTTFVAASVSLLAALSEAFLPTPTKSHYAFHIRDLVRVFSIIISPQASHISTNLQAIQLWYHECTRVFHDRLVDFDDRFKFMTIINGITAKYFSMSQEEIAALRDCIFVDFLSGLSFSSSRNYELIPNFYSLSKTLQDYLDDYNSQYSSSPMNLVMFGTACEHISRVVRMLRQTRGHSMLVGVTGTGRSSVVVLASHICGAFLKRVEGAQELPQQTWRETLKKVIRQAGMHPKSPIVLLVADVQVAPNYMLEDLTLIINHTDILDLWDSDEISAIVDDLRRGTDTLKKGTREELYELFVATWQTNLRVAMCASPAGDALRKMLRAYPSLIDCCHFDWFSEWPALSLKDVANQYITTLPVEERFGRGFIESVVNIHLECVQLSKTFFEDTGRQMYITPSHFLMFLASFSLLQKSKIVELEAKRNRYNLGIEKLQSASIVVAESQEQLKLLQPDLLATSKETSELLVAVSKQKIDLDARKQVIVEEEQIAADKTASAAIIKQECEKALADVIPYLKESEQALKSLQKEDVYEIKTMIHPPTGVRIVMEAVCIMKGIPPREIPGNLPGQKVLSYWESAKTMAKDMKFLSSLLNYDKDNIPESVATKIASYLTNPDFDPVRIRRQSAAATSLCSWVRAMMTYHEVLKVVRPKRKAVEEAEGVLQELRAKLREKKDKLHAIEGDIAKQLDQYDKVLERKEALARQVRIYEEQLDRATRMLQGLGGEMTRWQDESAAVQESSTRILGDMLAAAAQMTYLGPFTPSYRQKIAAYIATQLRVNALPHSQHHTLDSLFHDPLEQGLWLKHQLPHDKASLENAVMVLKAAPMPIIIDPQGQASSWLKSLLKDQKLTKAKPTDEDMIRKLENAIQFGTPILIEDVVPEQLHPSIASLLGSISARHINVLSPSTNAATHQQFVKVGDTLFSCADGFRLFITTQHPNPHFGPDATAHATLVEFTLTPEGLEEQLLGIGVAKIHSEVEEQKSRLAAESVAHMQMLTDVEDNMLRALSSAGTQFLEDEKLVESLGKAKATARNLTGQLAKTAQATSKLDALRSVYLPLAARGVLLFYILSDLHRLDPMYHYSLSAFVRLYEKAIENELHRAAEQDSLDLDSPLNPDQIPLNSLIAHFTYVVYINTMQSLMEVHKHTFALVLCAKVLIQRGELLPSHWNFMLTGGGAAELTVQINCPSWIPKQSWHELCLLAIEPGYSDLNLLGNLQSNGPLWQAYLNSQDIEVADMPLKQTNGAPLPLFYLLTILRCLKPEKVIPVIRTLIKQVLGPNFVDPPSLSSTEHLMRAYENSIPTSPILLLLTHEGGMGDPLVEVTRLAESKKNRRLVTLSMGQGQGQVAEQNIIEAIDTGRWVLLQNCHLVTSWLPALDRMVASIQPDRVHPDFRLWLTTYPTTAFPVTLLRQSTKVAALAARGVRPVLLRACEALSMSHHYRYAGAGGSAAIANTNMAGEVALIKTTRRLLFGLAFFHAVIIARKRYGTLGWSTQYEFTDADLAVSVRQLRQLLDTYDEIPYRAMLGLIGEIHYGGRVTDDWDRRTLLCVLQDFCNQKIHSDTYKLVSSSPVYCIPSFEKLAEYQNYVRALPLVDPPAIFGLNENAEIIYAQNELFSTLESILRMRSGSQSLPGDLTQTAYRALTQNIARELQQRIPQPTKALYGSVAVSSPLVAVLFQENAKFMQLFTTIHAQLVDLLAAFDGYSTMTQELEEVAKALNTNRVPAKWQAPGPQGTLRAWVEGIASRAGYVAAWKAHSDILPGHALWMGALFHPQAYLVATAQLYARKHRVSVDTVFMHAQVLQIDAESTIAKSPDEGCYAKGLYLEGASWDVSAGKLIEAKPHALYTQMPLIQFYPVINKPLPSPLSPPAAPTPSILLSTPSLVSVGSIQSTPSYSSGGLQTVPTMSSQSTPPIPSQHSSSTLHSVPSSSFIGLQTAPTTIFNHPITTPLTYTYLCPVYKSPTRGGHGKNYVCSVELQSDLPPDHWVKRGVCLVCSL